MFDILYNGSPITNLVIPSTASDSRQLTVVWSGPGGLGKLVQIETSCLFLISAVIGNLDTNGKFNFVVGPGFGNKGNVSITVTVSNAKRTVNIQFV